jgi:hypothetical protein
MSSFLSDMDKVGSDIAHGTTSAAKTVGNAVTSNKTTSEVVGGTVGGAAAAGGGIAAGVKLAGKSGGKAASQAGKEVEGVPEADLKPAIDKAVTKPSEAIQIEGGTAYEDVQANVARNMGWLGEAEPAVARGVAQAAPELEAEGPALAETGAE